MPSPETSLDAAVRQVRGIMGAAESQLVASLRSREAEFHETIRKLQHQNGELVDENRQLRKLLTAAQTDQPGQSQCTRGSRCAPGGQFFSLFYQLCTTDHIGGELTTSGRHGDGCNSDSDEFEVRPSSGAVVAAVPALEERRVPATAGGGKLPESPQLLGRLLRAPLPDDKDDLFATPSTDRRPRPEETHGGTSSDEDDIGYDGPRYQFKAIPKKDLGCHGSGGDFFYNGQARRQLHPAVAKSLRDSAQQIVSQSLGAATRAPTMETFAV